MKSFRYFMPWYWPIWGTFGLLWLLIQLPYRWQLVLGKGVGMLMYRFAKRSKHIAQVNIKLCFPEWTKEQRAALLQKSFINIGIALFEAGMGFWMSNRRLAKLITIKMDEEIAERQRKKKGVLLIGAHYTTIEIIGRACTLYFPFSVMYRPHKIGIINFILERSLKKHYTQAIPRNDVRSMIKRLKAGETAWYSADVNVKAHQGVFAPFFNVPASTSTAPMRLTEITGCVAVPIKHYRKPDGSGYVITFEAPLKNFPSTDPLHDATRINQYIEQAVRELPEQYLWQYMRFKSQPGINPKWYKQPNLG